MAAEEVGRVTATSRLGGFAPLQLPREPAPDNAWSRDAVITLVFALFAYVTGAATSIGAGFVSVLIALPLVFRRHYPMLMLYASTAGALVQLVLPTIQASLVVVPFVVYNVARWVAPPAAARLSVIIGLIGSVLGPVRWTTADSYYSGGPSLLMVYTFTCLVCVLAAYVFGRRRHESIRSVDERREAQEQTLRMQLAASEQRARAAEVNERNRIARELHDIVAHSLSVIVVQAEGGRALAAKKPEMAGDVLDTIAETSRDALTEMRRIVGVLRHGPESAPADWKPAPGLGDLADLVARTADRATLEVRGTIPQVSQTVGLTVYRVAQEALTNMLKHAGSDARGRVLLDCSRPGSVELVVRDDGVGAAAGSDGRGNGLRGMDERVHLVGGRLRTGPHPDGGFEVRARFPVGPVRSGALHPAPGRPAVGGPAAGQVSTGAGHLGRVEPPPTPRPAAPWSHQPTGPQAPDVADQPVPGRGSTGPRPVGGPAGRGRAEQGASGSRSGSSWSHQPDTSPGAHRPGRAAGTTGSPAGGPAAREPGPSGAGARSAGLRGGPPEPAGELRVQHTQSEAARTSGAAGAAGATRPPRRPVRADPSGSSASTARPTDPANPNGRSSAPTTGAGQSPEAVGSPVPHHGSTGPRDRDTPDQATTGRPGTAEPSRWAPEHAGRLPAVEPSEVGRAARPTAGGRAGDGAASEPVAGAGRPATRPAARREPGVEDPDDALTVSLDVQPTIWIDPDRTDTSIIPRSPDPDEPTRPHPRPTDQGRREPPRSRP